MRSRTLKVGPTPNLEHFAKSDSKGSSKEFHVVDRNVPLAAFDGPDIGSVEV